MLPIEYRQFWKAKGLTQTHFACNDISENVLLSFFEDAEGILKKLDPSADSTRWVRGPEDTSHLYRLVGSHRIVYSENPLQEGLTFWDSDLKKRQPFDLDLVISTPGNGYTERDMIEGLVDLPYVKLPQKYEGLSDFSEAV